MQHSKSDLAHSIALLMRDYPDGLSKQLLLNIAKKKLIFFSPKDCSEAGIELMTGALEKGLKLSSENYQIIIGESKFKNFLSGAINNDENLIIQFGESSESFASDLVTETADSLASNLEVKKIFWHQLQSIYQ